jgi:hypothetical protein
VEEDFTAGGEAALKIDEILSWERQKEVRKRENS